MENDTYCVALDQIQVNYKRYGKMMNQMIKRVLNPNPSSPNQNVKMSEKERFLLASCLDNLWRLIVLAQENTLSKELKLTNLEIQSKNNKLIDNICETCGLSKRRQNIESKLGVENSKEYLEIKNKLDHALEEKERLHKIADERLFDLQCIDKNADILGIKNSYKEFDESMNLILNEKKKQVQAFKILTSMMRTIIPSDADPDGKFFTRFKKRGVVARAINDGLDPRPINDLLAYLYKEYSDLFLIKDVLKDKVLLNREDVLKIIDEIPESLLLRCLKPPKKKANHVEIQTSLTMDPLGLLSRDQVYTAYNIAYPDSSSETVVKQKPKGPRNMLLKNIDKYLQNKKEKLMPMAEINAIKMINSLLEDKLQADIESEKAGKKLKLLSNFALDQMTMRFGLKTIAVKNMICMKEGLVSATKNFKKKNSDEISYSMMLSSIFGLEAQPAIEYDQDEVNLIMKARPLWMEAQESFKKNLKIRKNAKASDFSLMDLQTGGVCSALDVIEVFTNWCSKDKRILSGVLPKIIPDIPQDMKNNNKAIKRFYLDFSLMKICQKVAKVGKDIKAFYSIMDDDKSGSLDPGEILTGLTEKFNIYYSLEQAENLTDYLDEDGSGDVDLEEFKAKINYENYSTQYHLYTISYKRFLEILLEEWKLRKEITFSFYMSKFTEFDENGDGVLTFEEFEQLIKNLEKKMSREDISELFNETLEMDETAADLDKMNPD